LREVARDQPVGIALEEKGRRHLQHLRDVVKPARRNADIARLIFLHGLEGHADLAGERALAEAELNAAQPHAAADISVDRVRRVFSIRNHLNVTTHDRTLTSETSAGFW